MRIAHTEVLLKVDNKNCTSLSSGSEYPSSVPVTNMVGEAETCLYLQRLSDGRLAPIVFIAST